MGSFEEIPVDDIVTGNRIREDNGDVEKCARSIERFGLLHPVVVCRLPDARYFLLCGFIRLSAFRMLGRKTIPANVLDDNVIGMVEA